MEEIQPPRLSRAARGEREAEATEVASRVARSERCTLLPTGHRSEKYRDDEQAVLPCGHPDFSQLAMDFKSSRLDKLGDIRSALEIQRRN